MTLVIQEVQNAKDLKAFIDFPHELYKDDPNYVAELHIAIKDHLNPKRNPYFKHSEVIKFLAIQDHKVVGRILATVNNNYNEFHNCNVGFFGFFDCIDNQQVANLLLKSAEEYCSSQGVTSLLGPANMSTNDTAGLLVEGFDSPPVVQMTYNYPYYVTLVENYGFSIEMDMYAYKLYTSTVNKKALALSDRISQRLESKGISIRNINMKNFQSEVDRIREIYKEAWENNWGFVPPTEAEFDFLAEGLKLIVDERFAYMAEENGKTVGFAVGLPNINEILVNNRRGRLLPTAIFKLIFGKQKVKSLRIILLGVLADYRKLGIEAVFFSNFIKKAAEHNIEYGEASWILENNEMMRKGAENLNGQRYKTYRIYSKKIS